MSSFFIEFLKSYLLSFIIGCFIIFVYKYYKKYRRNYPPIFSYLILLLKGKFKLKKYGPLELIKAGYQKYGDIFTIRFMHKRVTFLIGPDASSILFKANDSEVSARKVYGFTIPVFGKGVVYDVEEKVMAQQVKFIFFGLGNKYFDIYCQKIHEEAKAYFNSWPDEGEYNIHEKMSELVTFTASRCLLGDEIRASVSTEFGPLYQKLSDGISHLSIFFPRLPVKAHRERDKSRKIIETLFTNIIKRRRETKKEVNDFLSFLMNSKYRDQKKLPDSEIIGILIATLFGGQHTSTITSSWFIMMIALYKDKFYQRYMDELNESLITTENKITLKTLDNMPLLQNSFSEVLRLFPPLIVLAREVLKTLKYKDYEIPKVFLIINFLIYQGDIIAVSPSITHRLPDVFENPEEFDPDRFNDERYEKIKRYSFQPFGGGRHMCVGRKFASLQVRIIVITFLKKFDFELKDKNWKPTIDYENIVSGPIDNTYIKFKRKR